MMSGNITLMGLFYFIYIVAVVSLMIKVVLNNRDTVKTLAWMLVLVFLPFLGLLLYFFFGRDTRKQKIISSRLLSQLQKNQLGCGSDGQYEVEPEYSSLATFFRNSSSVSLLGASEAKVILSPREFASLLYKEIDAAENHIHIQFYIFEDDEFGVLLREHLIAKAKQGVEVRVIYDSVGCLGVNKEFFEVMRCAGIYVESFMKVRFPLLTNKVNYRNHRKVVVIDGKVGFVGGCNIADRYLHGVKWGEWRDTMLLLRGAAVGGLQTSFLVDWYFTNRSLVCGKRYFLQQASGGASLVQVVQSNPVGEVRTIMTGMAKALFSAKGYAYLQTPYFMPNESFLHALKSAALSGVDVRLMIPEHSDSRLVDYATRSYLVDIMKAGVKVYLYGGGFLHSKTYVSDDYLSSVGSVNIDFRSFYYNFEVSAFVYGKDVALALKENFFEDMKSCKQLSLNGFMKGRSFKERCLESVARLFSPLL
ncbi:MAG: cardiolipin synthase [Bacteroidaceae bacterium]|nr:cardiolipin synthase [Bacteroidaceae bacterium]